MAPGGAGAEHVRMTPQPPSPAARRLSRPSDDRMLAGVASGLARHFDLDPALVRIAFVVLALFGGSGVLLYLILALILPPDDGPARIGPDASLAAKVVLGALVVFACVSLFSHP